MEHHPQNTALLITRNLPPLVGGMERLVWHIAAALAQEYINCMSSGRRVVALPRHSLCRCKMHRHGLVY